MNEPPRILAIDEDKPRVAPLAQAFNQAGFFLRYVADRKKALAGMRQLRPDLLLIRGEVRSDLVGDLLSMLASDAHSTNLPIALLCAEVRDRPFLGGLRTGIV